MADIVVQICRAEKDEQLQPIIGRAKKHWKDAGFTKVEVEYQSGVGSVGVFTMDDPAKPPIRVAFDTDDEQTAVLVFSAQ